MTSGSSAATPSARRRLASLLYEAILLFGVVFVPAYLFSALTRFNGDSGSLLRFAFQLTLFIAIGGYFVWCWRHGGQTLPMKTWKFRVVLASGAEPGLSKCWLRYVLAWIGPVAGLLAYQALVEISGYGSARFSPAAFAVVLPILSGNFLWVLLDRDRQFLHDRLAGTRLASVVA